MPSAHLLKWIPQRRGLILADFPVILLAQILEKMKSRSLLMCIRSARWLYKLVEENRRRVRFSVNWSSIAIQSRTLTIRGSKKRVRLSETKLSWMRLEGRFLVEAESPMARDHIQKVIHLYNLCPSSGIVLCDLDSESIHQILDSIRPLQICLTVSSSNPATSAYDQSIFRARGFQYAKSIYMDRTGEFSMSSFPNLVYLRARFTDNVTLKDLLTEIVSGRTQPCDYAELIANIRDPAMVDDFLEGLPLTLESTDERGEQRLYSLQLPDDTVLGLSFGQPNNLSSDCWPFYLSFFEDTEDLLETFEDHGFMLCDSGLRKKWFSKPRP